MPDEDDETVRPGHAHPAVRHRSDGQLDRVGRRRRQIRRPDPALAAGAPSIRIHGEDVPVRAEVARIDALSAHADANEIEQWLRGFERPPKRTFITHGEPAAADALRQRIERQLHWDVQVPDYLEQVELR